MLKIILKNAEGYKVIKRVWGFFLVQYKCLVIEIDIFAWLTFCGLHVFNISCMKKCNRIRSIIYLLPSWFIFDSTYPGTTSTFKIETKIKCLSVPFLIWSEFKYANFLSGWKWFLDFIASFDKFVDSFRFAEKAFLVTANLKFFLSVQIKSVLLALTTCP